MAAAAISAHVCTPATASALQALLGACQAEALAATALQPGAITLQSLPSTTVRYGADLIEIGSTPISKIGGTACASAPPAGAAAARCSGIPRTGVAISIALTPKGGHGRAPSGRT